MGCVTGMYLSSFYVEAPVIWDERSFDLEPR